MRNKYLDFFNKEELIEMYNNGMSVIEIAKKLQTKSQYIYRFFKYHNIKLRNHSESLKNVYKRGRFNQLKNKNNYRITCNKKIDKDCIIYLYFNKNLTKIQIAKNLDISISYLNNLFKIYNIEKKHRIGINNPHWKKGTLYDRKRKLIYCPKHPFRNHGKYVYEYILIMEKKLGRYINKQEVIHHLDGNVENNSIENLYLCKNQSEHFKIHFHRGK